MKLLIIIIIAFLVLVYAYAYIKYKKNKSKKIDTVSEFREKYLNKKIPDEKKQNSNEYTKYVTRYNSTVDYIEKNTPSGS